MNLGQNHTSSYTEGTDLEQPAASDVTRTCQRSCAQNEAALLGSLPAVTYLSFDSLFFPLLN